MTTTSVTSPTPLTSPLPTATATTSADGTQLSSANSLTASDFINMMVTQLQEQDPLNPTSSSDLLNQMSQIGQLQSSTQLSSDLQTMTLQSNIASASNMIGKMVQGLDSNGSPLSGQVTAVQVQNGQVALELDSGQSLALTNVTNVAPAPAATVAATASPAPATTPTVPAS